MSSSTSQPVFGDVVDALPYVDNDLEAIPGLREQAEALVAQELQNAGGLKDVHERFPEGMVSEEDLFKNSPALQSLLENYPNQTLSALDKSRYSLPTPEDDDASVEDWKAAADNARAQLEHLNVRQINLQLLSEHGSNAHLIHNHLLEAEAKRLEKAVEELKVEVVEINRRRKNEQTQASHPLARLNAQWGELISSTLQAELAVAALEGEVAMLQQKERESAE